MKNLNSLALCASLIIPCVSKPAAAAPAPAAITQGFVRVDANGGKTPYESVGVIIRLPDGSTQEGYVFGISDRRAGKFEELRVGQVSVMVKGDVTLRGGGYYSYFPGKGEHFALAWVDGSINLPQKATLRWCLGSHIPINGGQWTLFSNETAVTAPIDKKEKIRLGVATTFFERGGSPIRLRIGPKLEIKEGGAVIQLRYLPAIGDGKARLPEQLRLQVVF